MPIEIIFEALKFIFPAYCANAAPVIFGGGSPIDFGRVFLDGKPLLGANKTYRGFFAGLIIGTLVGVAEGLLLFHNLYTGLKIGFILSLGALFGDLTVSFLKRRLNFPPGALLPVADQLDFVVGALIFSLLVGPPSYVVVFVVIVITAPIHLLTNFFAYLLGLKREPW